MREAPQDQKLPAEPQAKVAKNINQSTKNMTTKTSAIVDQIRGLIPQVGKCQLPIEKTKYSQTNEWAHLFTEQQWENLPQLLTLKELKKCLKDIEKRIEYDKTRVEMTEAELAQFEEDIARF